MKDLKAGLRATQAAHLYRRRRLAAGAQQPHRHIDGQALLGFNSNDYLGLANHPRLIQAFTTAANHYGVGSGSAHLVNGHTAAHHQLEDALAEWTGRERALLFSTGYMANMGTVQALVGRGDTIVSDRINHASLVDGARLSGAKVRRYHHNDLAAAKQAMTQASGEKLLMVDGVFSMDGDLAPLPELAALAAEHDSWLMVDDAHGVGVLGETGAGIAQHDGCSSDDVPILMGTLGKALGTSGAFVAGDTDLIEHLIQHARTYIFTTAMPAAVAAATLESLKVIADEPERRARVLAHVQYFRQQAASLGIALMDSFTPIQGVLLGDNARALAASEALLSRGLHVTAIRPPTVPAGTARLRITFSASHTREDIDRLLTHLAEVLAEFSE